VDIRPVEFPGFDGREIVGMIADGSDGRGARDGRDGRDGRARPATGKPTAEWELVSWSRPSSGILLGAASLRARYELPPLPTPLPPLSSPGSRLLHLCTYGTYILTCGHVLLLLHPIDLANASGFLFLSFFMPTDTLFLPVRLSPFPPSS
jgi:hypothetical protein